MARNPKRGKAANGSPFKTGYYYPDDQLAHEIKVKMKLGKSEGRAIAEVAGDHDVSDAQLERVLNLLEKKGRSRRRNPEVWLDWQQRGHTMLDPTGQSLHKGRALWRKGLSKRGAKREAAAARKYARRQKDWTKYGVTVKRNPRKELGMARNPRRRRRSLSPAAHVRQLEDELRKALDEGDWDRARWYKEEISRRRRVEGLGMTRNPRRRVYKRRKNCRANPRRRVKGSKRRKMSRLVKRRLRNAKGQFVKRNRSKRR